MSDNNYTEPEVETLTFDVTDEEAGQRLDAFLAARIEGVSRTTLKRIIEDGDALVAGRAAKPSRKLCAGEHVEVELTTPPPLDLAPEDIPLDIVHEDAEIVVVNKPAGMVVHPAAGVTGGTLPNAIAYRLGIGGRGSGAGEEDRASSKAQPFAADIQAKEIDCATSDPGPRRPTPDTRPGIVHRLDRDTSGLIVVAKTPAAHEHLAEQFRARTVFKSYVALAHGRLKEEAGRIEEPIGRDPRQRTRMAVVRGGREALTLWRVRRAYDRFTLLDVRIKTGRTHQIRVHLAWLKHPVVGDEVYGMGRDANLQDARLRAAISTLGRQFLHAEQLAFAHPRSGERLIFKAPLPAELNDFLEKLNS